MSLSLRRTFCSSRIFKCYSTSCSEHDFTKSVEEFKRNGVTILPLKVETDFVEKSKKLCFNAWEDAMERGKIIKGHEIKVGKDQGFKEIVMRAPGRYDMQWKIDGDPHFLNQENILSKFLPFVHEVLGGEKMTKMDFNGCLFSLPGAKEQLWHVDGEHLFTSEDNFKLCGNEDAEFFNKHSSSSSSSILPAHCLNIFIPLVDVESNNGGTEFCLGSHFHTKFFPEDIVWQNSEWKERIGFNGEVMTIKVNAGEVLAFDYRVLHRALDHQGQEIRPVLYYTFTKRWFSDAMNFAELPSLTLADGKQKPVENKVDAWRQHFPQLVHNSATIYCDGAAGSQIPQLVIDAMTGHLSRYGSSNLGGNYPTSQAVTALVADARAAGRDLFGNPGDDVEIMFGYNCSNLMFHLSHAMTNSRLISSSNNIVLSPACHDANVASWLYLSKNSGAETRWLPLLNNDDHATSDKVDIDKLEQVIDENTRVICLALASNVTGRTHLEAVTRITEMIKTMKVRPYLILDATHFIPHQCCDLVSLAADAVVCSAYKYFGPHLGVMAYNRESFSRLSPTKVGVRFSEAGEVVEDLLYPGDVPAPENCQISRWENGTPNYEGLAGFTGCVDYIAGLSGGVSDTRRGAVVESYQQILKHEAELSERFVARIQPLLDSNKVVNVLPHNIIFNSSILVDFVWQQEH